MLHIVLLLISVGILWGCTNPFIKLGSKGIDQIENSNIFLEIAYIGKRLKYWIPFLINQAGSVLYVWTLRQEACNMIVAVPVANSLSFVFTAITGYFLGENIPGKRIIIGSIFVCAGSSMIMYDQVIKENANKIENTISV